MGNCGSDVVVFVECSVDGQDSIASEAFKKIPLTKNELDKLFNVYAKIDYDKRGYVTAQQLKAFFRAEENVFNAKLFCDFANTGHINFFEFAMIVSKHSVCIQLACVRHFTCQIWNFLSTSPSHIGLHAFFCVNRSDHLQPGKLKQFMEIIYGGKINGVKSLVSVHDKLVGSSEGSVGLKVVQAKEFDNICQENSAIMSAILMFQLSLRKDFLGEAYWSVVGARRAKDAIASAPEFIYALCLDVCRQYTEKNTKLKIDERVQQLGKDRAAITEVLDGMNKGSAGGTNSLTETIFDHSKIKFAAPKEYQQKKESLLRQLEDEAAIQVINLKNSPEKSRILATHEFRYTSDGMGVASPGAGDWGATASTPKPNSPKPYSPRAGSPRGIKVVVDTDRPISRGSSADRDKARHATQMIDTDGFGRPVSRDGTEKQARRATENDIHDRPASRGLDGDRSNSRLSDADRPRSRNGDGGRPRHRSSSPSSPRLGSPLDHDSPKYNHTLQQDKFGRPQSPLNKQLEPNVMAIHD